MIHGLYVEAAAPRGDLVASADVIGMEKLDVRRMTRSAKGTIGKPGVNVAAKSGLNRALPDASFGIFRRLIGEKAESAARRVVDVEARYSSQECSKCGTIAERGAGDPATSAVGARE
jgi:putative transposase